MINSGIACLTSVNPSTPGSSHITTMDEDTRRLILNLQSEDLATLWADVTTNNDHDIDATIRVYRRQRRLLD